MEDRRALAMAEVCHCMWGGDFGNLSVLLSIDLGMGLEKHMRRIIGFIVSLVLAICCCAGVARAEIRHVPERYSTIQAAIDVMAAMDAERDAEIVQTN